MTIEENDFRLTNSSGLLWDLELLHTVKPKGKPERQEFQNEGYGMSLESCIKRIINYRLSNKKDVYSLKEYVTDFKTELSQLKTLLNNM